MADHYCQCGQIGGFVDMGPQVVNRYPCRQCYLQKPALSAEAQEYLSYFKTPAAMADLHWPSESQVAIARAKKIFQNP